MPGYFKIRFFPSGLSEGFAGSRGNYYEFADGTQMDMRTTPVWCHRCSRITHGEDIKTVEGMDQELAEGRRIFFERHKDIPKDFMEALSRRQAPDPELEHWREWRATRVSPPRCIRCGSTNIFVFPVNQPAPHPAGLPGTIEVSLQGMCSTEFNIWFFTPEGNRIPRDTKPAYWRHPSDDFPWTVLRWLRRRFGGR